MAEAAVVSDKFQTYKEAQQTAATGAAFTHTQFNNFLSLSLEPGVWELSALVTQAYIATLTDWSIAISVNSGNTTTDHVEGINQVSGRLGITALNPGAAAIPSYLLTLNATTTVRLKVKPVVAVADAFVGKLFARRLR